MWDRINTFRRTQLFEASFFTGISTLIKMISAFIISKVVSVLLGPSGLALIGQLSSFSAIVLTISTCAIQNGIVKYVSEYRDDYQLLSKLISTSLRMIIISSICVGLILIIFANYWSVFVLKSASYSSLFVIFGITVICYSINALLLSIINGLKLFRLFNTINIISSIISVILSVILIHFYNFNGALHAIILSQSVVFAFTLWLINKRKTIKKDLFVNEIDRESLRKLSRFILMAVVSAVAIPLSQIIIRNEILSATNLNVVGYYEGMNRLSNIYLTIITTTFITYYLPRLSEIKDKLELRSELKNLYKLIIPLLLLLSVVIMVFKDVIISVVFSEEFTPMRDYFAPQLIGDFFKMCSWVLAMQMIAKAMVKMFLITEIIFTVSLIILSVLMVKQFGGIGSIYAYCINYFLYLITVLFIFRKTLFEKN
jgi:PST family polysaccharide transporter